MNRFTLCKGDAGAYLYVLGVCTYAEAISKTATQHDTEEPDLYKAYDAIKGAFDRLLKGGTQ